MRRLVYLGIALAPLLSVGAVLAGEADDCERHAAAMVAEMQAASDTPLAEEQIELIRETALRSCRKRGGGAEPQEQVAPRDGAPASNTPSADAADGAADEKQADGTDDGTIWDSVKERMKTPPVHKEGHDRLKRRRSGGM